ncbi:MAG: hypothetical protein ABIK36_15980 [Pseudomonadota bacterium]
MSAVLSKSLRDEVIAEADKTKDATLKLVAGMYAEQTLRGMERANNKVDRATKKHVRTAFRAALLREFSSEF